MLSVFLEVLVNLIVTSKLYKFIKQFELFLLSLNIQFENNT